MDRELVDAGQVGTALAVLSGVAVVLAIVLFALGRQCRSASMSRGALVAAAAILVFPLWLVYNGIEDRFGLDSVAALGINLVLFAAVGIGIGLALRRLWPETHHGDTEIRREE